MFYFFSISIAGRTGRTVSRRGRAPSAPRTSSYVASFNGKLLDELLDREIFYTLTEVKILIERWRRQYNTVRPHSALGYRPPAPAAISPASLSGVIMSPALS